MRTDDPVILRRLEQIESACAGLRMACGFPALIEIANTSTRASFQCQTDGCSYSAYERDDLQAHMEFVHDQPKGPATT